MKHSTTTNLCLAGTVLVCVILALPYLGGWFSGCQLHRARQEWKRSALPEIARLANDSGWVAQETARLGVSGTERQEGVIAKGWLSDHMILMGSREWLVYRSHCNKAPPHDVRDIFLAKGSDGTWYYSTCHFCVGMVTLLMVQEEQPADLGFFVKRYHLREFDGKSDECLKETKAFPDDI